MFVKLMRLAGKQEINPQFLFHIFACDRGGLIWRYRAFLQPESYSVFSFSMLQQYNASILHLKQTREMEDGV
jgi:hypothetical protein